MVVGVVAGQAIADFVKRKFRQEGNAVERFLSMNGDIVAERLERLARKRIIDAFGFLQAHDVWLALVEPGHRRIKALLDRIDIPGGDAHGSQRPRARSSCRSRMMRSLSDC